jgi:hypothetical protein
VNKIPKVFARAATDCDLTILSPAASPVLQTSTCNNKQGAANSQEKLVSSVIANYFDIFGAVWLIS